MLCRALLAALAAGQADSAAAGQLLEAVLQLGGWSGRWLDSLRFNS